MNRLFATDIEKIPPLVRTSDWSYAERILRQTLSDWAENRRDDEEFLRETEAMMAKKFERQIAPQTVQTAEAR